MLAIEGEFGTFYSIQSSDDLSRPNSWRDQALIRTDPDAPAWVNLPTTDAQQRYYRAVSVPAPTATNLVFITPGTFMMGSLSNEVGRLTDEGPQRAVTMSSGFWMGRNLVIYRDYQSVMGTNGHYPADLTLPEKASWEDATNYCALLTKMERAAGRIPTNTVYRLPTEAEWEYACRAGTTTRFSYGDDPGYTNLDSYAWHRWNSGDRPHSVGQKLPNPWGLYDMHGNVWEWCQDVYGAYPGGTAVKPPGPLAHHVFRGGSCQDDQSWCRSARR